MDKILLTFESVNHTMLTEKELNDIGFKTKTIPTPREISQSCGLTIMLDPAKLDKVKELKKKLPIAHIWSYTKNNDKIEVYEIN